MILWAAVWYSKRIAADATSKDHADDGNVVDSPREQDDDLDQIVERLSWTPRQRLQYLLGMLAFEGKAHRSRPNRIFDPEAILRLLEKYQVRFVLIGGLAATLHGSPLRTGGADICPSEETSSLGRLAEALESMKAENRHEQQPEGLPFSCDGEFLKKTQMLNLVSQYGDLGISLVPSGTAGYNDLVQNAVKYDLEGLVVPVAALADIIRSKEAAGRSKDKAMLPTLRTLLREIKNP